MKNESMNQQQDNIAGANQHQTTGGSATQRSSQTNTESTEPQKGNITVDNEGNIGKPSEQWDSLQQEGRRDDNSTGKQPQPSSKKEKMIPQQESYKNSK